MSDDNKEGAGVPVAEWQLVPIEPTDAMMVAWDKSGALDLKSEHFDDYPGDEWVKKNAALDWAAMLAAAPTPPAVMPAAPSDADARLLHAFGRRTAFEIGDHALPLMLGPNWNHQGCYGENSEWLCLRFNSIEERDEFRAAARAWENVARERADAACQACGDSGVVTDTEGHKWPCYQRCSALSQTMQPKAESAPSMDRFEHVIRWVRDNYQDHSIASLCDGLRAAYYALCRPAEPAAGGQAGAVADVNPFAYRPYCLNCEKEGHRTRECHSTYAVNARSNEIDLLAAPGAAIAAREQEATAPRYGFLCYSCSHEWEANAPTTDCPAEGCGTTNNFNVDHGSASREEAPVTPQAGRQA